MHITAVEFGTSSRQRRRWAERISAGEIADGVVDRYRQGVADDDAVAERMALHERFWPVTYHWVALRNGDVLFNNAAERYTYHGNRSNRFALGISIEADFRDARLTGVRHTPSLMSTSRRQGARPYDTPCGSVGSRVLHSPTSRRIVVSR